MSATSVARPSVIDIALDIGVNVEWFRTVMLKLANQLRRNVTHGPPSVAFPIERVQDAFQLLRSGGHVGKILITSPLTSLAHVVLRHDVVSVSGYHKAEPSAMRSIIDLKTILGLASDIANREINADAPLMEAGVDSLGVVELRNQLQDAAGLASLPATIVFEHPTARQLSSAVLSEPGASAESVVRPTASLSGGASRASVAVGGGSALLPAGASPQRLASRMFACAWDAISEVPLSGWVSHTSSTLPEHIATRARHAGFVLGPQLIDNTAFGVSPAEVAAMDPCQRLLLEYGYAAMHNVALHRACLRGSPMGVFIGFGGSEFGDLLFTSPAGSSVFAATLFTTYFLLLTTYYLLLATYYLLLTAYYLLLTTYYLLLTTYCLLLTTYYLLLTTYYLLLTTYYLLLTAYYLLLTTYYLLLTTYYLLQAAACSR